MPPKFHQRFKIPISEEAARRRFINRVYNEIWDAFLGQFHSRGNFNVITRAVISHLGERYDRDCDRIAQATGDDFLKNLHAIEGLYDFLRGHQEQDELDCLVTNIIAQSEFDLSIRWEKGQFYSSGSPLLDDKAVNDVLGLLSNPAHAGAAQAFHKGLDHFLRSTKNPDLLSDVVNRMYEALEATAKVICKNNNDLTGNGEAFVSQLKLPDPYKRFLKEYIKYANDLHRHAADRGKPKSPPSRREVEAFMYLTGLFIRVALSKDS
jgi:hypothetical protein